MEIPVKIRGYDAVKKILVNLLDKLKNTIHAQLHYVTSYQVFTYVTGVQVLLQQNNYNLVLRKIRFSFFYCFPPIIGFKTNSQENKIKLLQLPILNVRCYYFTLTFTWSLRRIFMSSMTSKMRANLFPCRINWQIVLCAFVRLKCIHVGTACSQ